MNVKESLPIILLTLMLFLGLLSIKLQSPPAVVGKTSDLTEFSAERAMDHMKFIARAPHSGGTPEHLLVRNYIIDFCNNMGLEVVVQDTLAARVSGNRINASYVSNVLAKLPGAQPTGKHILVLSHYDSQPNTLGAADDGAGVVAMMESIRALKQKEPLKHDVYFLFTDQEEVGLLGAEAFVNTQSLVQETGVFLNYESRGNDGVALIFEVNENNGWVIQNLAQGAPYPVANSMAYEVYRLMPNDSDFSMFRKGQYAGINQANIDGFVHYHSMTDNPENINPRIIQHHGANLLALIRHFDQQDLSETKSDDLNFFNPIGHWLIYFPKALNIPLMLLVISMFVAFVYLNKDVPSFSALNTLKGSGVFLLALIGSILISFLLTKLLLLIYPHYSNFYANNFYNVHWYLPMYLGSAFVSFGLSYQLLKNYMETLSSFTGVILFCLLIMASLHIAMPTATYILYYPLMAMLLALLIKLVSKRKGSPLVFLFIGLIPLIFLWSPIIYILFVVFSLVIPYAAVALFALVLGLSIPFWQTNIRLTKSLRNIGIGLILLSLIMGHLTSKPTKTKPLQSDLAYCLDLDKDLAYWISNNAQLDRWTKNYVSKKLMKNPIYGDLFNWEVWSGDADKHELNTIDLKHEIKNLSTEEFQHIFRLSPDSSTIGVELIFQGLDNQDSIRIDGRVLPVQFSKNRIDNRINIHAIDKTGLEISLVSKQGMGFKVTVIERKLRIPESWLKVPMPEDHIPGPGTYADAIFVRKTYEL